MFDRSADANRGLTTNREGGGGEEIYVFIDDDGVSSCKYRAGSSVLLDCFVWIHVRKKNIRGSQ